MRIVLAVLLFAAAVGIVGCPRREPTPTRTTKYHIAIIVPIDAPGVDAAAIRRGAETAIGDSRATLWWMPALGTTASDRTQVQLSLFDQALAKKANAIVLVADGVRWFAGSLRAAAQAKCPVVLLDHGGEPAAVQAVIGTDNGRVGPIMAREAASLKKGNVLLISAWGDPASVQRTQATLAGLKSAHMPKPLELRLTARDGVIDCSPMRALLPLLGKSPPNVIIVLESDEDLDRCLAAQRWTHRAKWIVYGSNSARRRRREVVCIVTPDAEKLATSAVSVALRAMRQESFEPKIAIPPLVVKAQRR